VFHELQAAVPEVRQGTANGCALGRRGRGRRGEGDPPGAGGNGLQVLLLLTLDLTVQLLRVAVLSRIWHINSCSPFVGARPPFPLPTWWLALQHVLHQLRLMHQNDESKSLTQANLLFLLLLLLLLQSLWQGQPITRARQHCAAAAAWCQECKSYHNGNHRTGQAAAATSRWPFTWCCCGCRLCIQSCC
jgi:hypothetical protein